MRSPRHGSAPRKESGRGSRRRRALVTTAIVTGAALAVGTGVALDRLVVPAVTGEPQSTGALPAPGPRADAAEGAPTGPANAPESGATAPQAPDELARSFAEQSQPLKELRMRLRDRDGAQSPKPEGSGSGGGSGDSGSGGGDSGGDSGGGGGSGGSGGGGSGGDTSPPPSGLTGMEAQVVELTNQERAKAGCPALRVDGRLVAAARAHSADMAAKGYFSHTSPSGETFADRIKKAGYPSPGAENIAMGYPTAAAVMKGWMNSSGHRANILNCGLKAIGVGVQTGSGGPWWTQTFGWA